MRKLVRGCSTCFCLRRYNAKNNAPRIAGTQIYGLANPKLEALENPSNKPPKPKAESNNDKTSSLADEFAWGRRVINTAASSRRTNAQTNSATKKLRHPANPIIHPPMVGPMLGAKPIAMPAMPITVACLSRGKEVITMLIIMGMVMPADTA